MMTKKDMIDNAERTANALGSPWATNTLLRLVEQVYSEGCRDGYKISKISNSFKAGVEHGRETVVFEEGVRNLNHARKSKMDCLLYYRRYLQPWEIGRFSGMSDGLWHTSRGSLVPPDACFELPQVIDENGNEIEL